MKLRAVVRLLRVALHLCRVVLTIALVYPRHDETRQLALRQQWSARLIELLGISLAWSGDAPPAGLLVSNHISFVDICAINAIAPASFVAKQEVRSWPLIGWLSKHVDTLFLERGSRAECDLHLRGQLAGCRWRQGLAVAIDIRHDEFAGVAGAAQAEAGSGIGVECGLEETEEA